MQGKGNANMGPQQINIDPSQTSGVTCFKCNGELFMPMFILRKVSMMVSPTGREEVIQVPVMVCSACGLPYTPEAEEMVRQAQAKAEKTSTPSTEIEEDSTEESNGTPIGEAQSKDGSKIVGAK